MTNGEQTIANLKKLKSFHNGSYGTDIDRAIKALEQEPTTKNDLVTLTFSKGTLKYSCKDYVVYKKDWLRSHYGAEIDIMFGDSQYKEPTPKNDLAVDCVARQDVERYIEGFINEYTPKEELEFINLELDGLKHLPSVTPQEPILDKLRAEIEKKIVKRPWLDFEDRERDRNDAFLEVLDILDKYKGESEENNAV